MFTWLWLLTVMPWGASPQITQRYRTQQSEERDLRMLNKTKLADHCRRLQDRQVGVLLGIGAIALFVGIGGCTQIRRPDPSAVSAQTAPPPHPRRWGRLGSGLLARVRLPTEAGDRAIVLPKSAIAIAENAPQPTVFVVKRGEGAEDTVTSRPVTIGQATPQHMEITAGLSAGEAVVVRSAAPLATGHPMRLSILSEEPSSQPVP